MKCPAYPLYKPSGVDWLGDVPEHWEVKRLKWVGESIIGLTYSPTDLVSEGEGTLVLRSSNIQAGRIVLDDNVFVSAEIPRKLRTREDDILICTRNGSRNLVGKTGKISKRESGLTFGAFTAVFRSSANDYMFYVFNSGLFSFQAGLYQTSTIFQLTNGTINAFQIPLPDPAEQRAIAAFLDRETGRVDCLMAKKRELIERLKEKRAALISRTVTRGLPPAAARSAGLNPHPKLKPSGIEWLGDVPEHWNVMRLRFLVDGIVDTEHKTVEFELDGEYLVARTTNIRGGKLVFNDAKYTNEDGFREWTRRGKPQPGEILFTREAPAGEACIVPSSPKLCLGQRVVLLRVKQNALNSTFAIYSIYGGLAHEFIAALSAGSTVPHFNMSDISSIPFLVPAIAEQRAITDYLDRETTKIDRMVEKVEAAIECLREYRTALITAAVTGKIDVRGVRADNMSVTSGLTPSSHG